MGEAFWSVIADTSGVLLAGVGARWFPVASAALVTKFAGRVLPSLDGSRFSTMPVTATLYRAMSPSDSTHPLRNAARLFSSKRLV